MNFLGSWIGALVVFLVSLHTDAAPPTRAEVLEIARTYAELRWAATQENFRNGRDASGIEVHTPDSTQTPGGWTAGAENIGMPYKWGGFDSLESFDTGVKRGKAAGDLYSMMKRLKGGASVSSQAVGVDCSGFISRCWKLDSKRGTSTLVDICTALGSPEKLQPGDIMNQPGGHVVLFAKWIDEAKTTALFYEAEPFSKVLASEKNVGSLLAAGFKPMRYRKIRE